MKWQIYIRHQYDFGLKCDKFGNPFYEVRLWDARDGNCLHVLQCEIDGLRSYSFEENFINFSPNGQLLACRGAEVKVFKVATGKVVAVCEVKGKMVCWNNSGNKLAVVTNAQEEVDKGRRIVHFDMQKT